MRSFRRWLITIGLHLAFGAVFTLVLAMACVLWAPMTDLPTPDAASTPSFMSDVPAPSADSRLRVARGVGVTLVEANTFGQRYNEAGRLEYWHGGKWLPHDELPGHTALSFDVTRIEGGFPFRCLTGQKWSSGPHVDANSPAASARVGISTVQATEAWTILDDGRFIPMTPDPIGFVANTVTYALAFIVLVQCWRGGRGLMRGWTGRCARCGYQLLRDANACTECGRHRSG